MTTTRTKRATASRPRGRSGLALLLALATLLASCGPEPSRPTAIGDVADGRRFAQDVAGTLLVYSAYDWALAGGLAGEKTRIVNPDRWAAVVRSSGRTLTQLSAAAISASADASGPVRDRLLALADELTELVQRSSAYADGREPSAFAAVIDRVAGSWSKLRDLAATLPPDASVTAALARGPSIGATAKAESRWSLHVGPFATRAEADAAATAIGVSESIGAAAPFVIRVATFPSKELADIKGSSLKGMPGFLVVEEPRWLFGRTGPVPEAELWREPARVFDLPQGTRRVAVSSDGAWIAAGADDGTIALFTGEGALRGLPKLRVGIAHLGFADDAKTLMAGGVNLTVMNVPGLAQLGPSMTLTSPATQVVFVPAAGARAFVATAKGPTGQPAGGDGMVSARAPDGVALGAPFPIVTPAAGALLAVTDAGELYIATPAAGGGSTDIEVLRIGYEASPRPVVKVNGSVRTLAIDRGGSLGAVLTDQGVFRFEPKAADPARSLKQAFPAVREIAFGAGGILYLLEQTKLSAVDRDGKTLWTAALSDGRRLVVGARTVVVDGVSRVILAGANGSLDELGVGGAVTDVSISVDGRRVAVAVDARRGLVFTLP